MCGLNLGDNSYAEEIERHKGAYRNNIMIKQRQESVGRAWIMVEEQLPLRYTVSRVALTRLMICCVQVVPDFT